MTATAPTGETGPEPSLLAEFRLTHRVASLLAIVSIGGFVPFVVLFGAVHGWATGHPVAIGDGTVTVSTPGEMVVGLLPLVVLLVGVTAVHELLHGVVMSRYGARPTYGVGLSYLFPYAYASGGGAVYTRNQALVVLLAPLVVISTVGVVALAVIPSELPVFRSELLVIALAANAAGSTSDCWMASVLARFPAGVRVADLPESHGSGFGIYGDPEEVSGTVTTVTGAASTFVAGAFATIGILLAGIVLAVFHAAATGSGTVVLGDPDGFAFLFSHRFDPETHVATYEVGSRLLTAVAAVGGVCAATVAVIRTRFACRREIASDGGA